MQTLAPDSEAELLDMVRAAAADRTPMAVQGGGTRQGVGRPVDALLRLDLSGLAGIRSYEPQELVLTAWAGTPMVEVEAALEGWGQHLAFEPPDLRALLGSRGTPTLGGALGSNFAGPRRILAGASRDHFLGFAGVSGRGEAFKAGGKVVKNVTGYDLSKLMAGSWGTLAVLSEVTIKVLPRPERACTVVVSGLDTAPAVAAMTTALAAPAEVSGASWLPARMAALVGLAMEPALLLRLEGSGPAVAWRARALSAMLERYGPISVLEDEATAAVFQQLRDVAPLAADPSRTVWRISLPPTAGAAFLAALPQAEGFIDHGGALVWLSVPDAPDGGAAQVRAALEPHGGHALMVRGAADVRAQGEPFQPLAAPLMALTARVKASFDPLGVLNPGRMYRQI
ncbi:MAG TPA: glycolate oxidase subunit GlcE [Caulobacteraceae bacterium]|jgi:glycolate oxidase FAD binding subunit|nr:glycolate oxidase subunit GlcE [Caulobacteraceae bacterium]